MNSKKTYMSVLFLGSVLGGSLVFSWEKDYFNCVDIVNISGFLSGIFTMGLFGIALFTLGDWKRQKNFELKRNTLIDLYKSLLNYLYEERILSFYLKEENKEENKEGNKEGSSSQADKVILAAKQCDTYFAVYESLINRDISSYLKPDFTYFKLLNRMEEETFKIHEWKEIIDNHELLAEKSLREELNSIS